MTDAARKRVEFTLSKAYDVMATEVSTSAVVTKEARKLVAAKLFQASMEDRRTTMCKLCKLLRDRFGEPRRFHISKDLDLLDATKDLLEYGERMDWRITREMELVFV